MLKKLILLSFAAIILPFGCWNPFSTREAENPISQETLWNQPETPAIVLSNLKKSYENRHLDYYLESFTEDFEFIADPHEKNGVNSHLYKNWNKEIEKSVTAKIFDLYSNEEIYLSLSPLPNQQDPVAPNGTATLYRNYEFYITNTNIIPPENSAKGVAIFEMEENSSGYWAIETWSDQRKDTIDWGEFKGNFR